MEREKSSVTENMEMSPAMYSLLEQDGLKSALPPHLHIDYKKDLNKLVLSGFKIDVIECKNWILEKRINMKQKSLQSNSSILDFLRSVDCDQMSTELFLSNGIPAFYTIEKGDVVVFGSSETALAEAEIKVNAVLTTTNLTVEDQGVLQMTEWQDLKKHQQESFNTFKKTSVFINLSQRDNVMVTGFREPVMEVSENLERFIEEHTRIEESVCVKSNAVVEFIKDRKSQDWQQLVASDKVNVSFVSEKPLIKLTGERSFVQPAITFFKHLADALYTDTLVIKKVGAKEYFKEHCKTILSMFVRETGFVVVPQEDNMLKEKEEDFAQVPPGRICNSCLRVYILQMGHLRLEVSCGDITKEKTDAIVNSSNKTFSLKTGVSKAILDAAGLLVKKELLRIAKDTNYQLEEIVTSSGNLPCKEVIHVVGCSYPDYIKQKVSCVLELCEKHKFTSVAFPALGTGQGGANPADVADAMITAVLDFARKKESVHVKTVKFLIFHTSMLADFHQNMVKIAMKPKKVLLGRKKGKNILFEEIEPVVFQLCGERPEELTKASAMINSLLNQDINEVKICDPAIAHFSKEELEMLSTMERELKVSIYAELKGHDSVITLKGLPGFISTAESRTRDIIRKVERTINRSQLAILTSSVVEWQYQSGLNFKAFDIFTNCDLEEALNHQITRVKIRINNKEYKADIQSKVAAKGRQRIVLRRVQKDAAQSVLPSNWEDMEEQPVVLVKLTSVSEEFIDVEKKFKISGLSSNIVKIERVQNSALWKIYMIKKEEMESKNKHTNNEKRLFHGTSHDKTEQINHYGFNRSYAGMHGAMYGNGTYFAVDPSYSARRYSKPDANGHKCIYLARVLVGDFAQGEKGLLTPPPKSAKGVHLHDSVTDNTKNPSMFVIFSDVQAYPEYLITFKDK